MKHILKCPACSSYGLKGLCDCGTTRLEIKPVKYSPEDKYGDYRRKAKIMKEKTEKIDRTSMTEN